MTTNFPITSRTSFNKVLAESKMVSARNDDKWIKLPSLYKVLLKGNGSVNIDVKNIDGTIVPDFISYSVNGNRTEYPFFGQDAYEIKVNVTNDVQMEIV
jgi:hypothetical protein